MTLFRISCGKYSICIGKFLIYCIYTVHTRTVRSVNPQTLEYHLSHRKSLFVIPQIKYPCALGKLLIGMFLYCLVMYTSISLNVSLNLKHLWSYIHMCHKLWPMVVQQQHIVVRHWWNCLLELRKIWQYSAHPPDFIRPVHFASVFPLSRFWQAWEVGTKYYIISQFSPRLWEEEYFIIWTQKKDSTYFLLP